MNDVLAITLIIAGISAFSVGGGLWFYFYVLNKKNPTWKALVYQLSDSKYPRQLAIDTDGKPLLNKDGKQQFLGEEINRLEFYMVDTLIKGRIQKSDTTGEDLTVYKLKVLNRTTPMPTADYIENIPKFGRCVRVLLQGDSCTLLRNGYDSKLNANFFNPMSYDRTNGFRNDAIVHLSRTQDKKNWLIALAIIGMIFICLSMVAVGYFMSKAYTGGMEELTKSTTIRSDADKYSEGIYLQMNRDALYQIYGRPFSDNITQSLNLGRQTFNVSSKIS